MKSLEHPVIKSQRIVKGSVLFMWYILLPTPEVYVKVATWELITKDLIVRIDYEGWSRVSNDIRGLSSIIGEHLAAFFASVRQDTRCLLR